MHAIMQDIREREARHQPPWADVAQLRRVCDSLELCPPLTTGEDVRALRALLARVAHGQALVVQAGDCAEDVDDSSPRAVARRAAVLDLLAGALRVGTGLPVVRVGRIAGQFAKPRSSATEHHGGEELPVYRGDMVNGREPTHASRRADPLRILTGYMAARAVMEHLGWSAARDGRRGVDLPTWTSHETLLLDYELPMLRRDALGDVYLGSTHWPWIGERTRQVDGAHVALLARVVNPVSCKIGPTTTGDEVVALCDRLDPHREPGRLTLVARMGAGVVASALPPLVRAVAAAGHPVVWMTDPMHGNTIVAPGGHKTRMVETVAREVREFCDAVRRGGGTPGGLHLETTPDDVTECADDAAALARVGERYTTLCDPRLTPRQALRAADAWVC